MIVNEHLQLSLFVSFYPQDRDDNWKTEERRQKSPRKVVASLLISVSALSVQYFCAVYLYSEKNYVEYIRDLVQFCYDSFSKRETFVT